jgi:hypothetical protein
LGPAGSEPPHATATARTTTTSEREALT